ncbi:MAG: pyridoxamine 5'-phosphate oxidase family protein [Planctomycetota bacterium]|jgi:hypothetical protein
MDLKTLFETTTGLGVLATADVEGKVNQAIYARPHVLSEDRVAFVMADRLHHENIKSNPRAAYLYRIESETSRSRYEGVRLILTRLEEDTDPERIRGFLRRDYGEDEKTRFLVTFRVDEVFPLVGTWKGGAGSKPVRKMRAL